jgi:hypothetical protein
MRMGFLENTPKLPNDFSSPQDIGLRNFLADTPEMVNKKGQRFVETSVVGACTKCKMAGSVAVPMDLDYHTSDKMLDGRIVKVFCPKCKQTTEFRPLSPEELNEEQFFIMRRYYDIYKKEVVEGREIPEHLKVFIDEYEKRLRHAQSKKLPAMPKGVAPEVPPGHTTTPSGLVIPE